MTKQLTNYEFQSKIVKIINEPIKLYVNKTDTVMKVRKSNEQIQKWLKCYPSEEIDRVAFSKLLNSGVYTINNDCVFNPFLVDPILKKHVIKIVIPTKLAPLVIFTRQWVYLIAPRTEQEVYDMLDDPVFFKEITGCRCKLILESKENNKKLKVLVEEAVK